MKSETNNNQMPAPDSTAVRVALWRAMHMQIDSAPHVFEDMVGLQLASPPEDWRLRPDMDAEATRPFRASIIARARFLEDLVIEQANLGMNQYVILGAGLDSFAQRRPEIASKLKIFEVDRPSAQAWKRQRLLELGFDIPHWLKFVSIDFDADSNWWNQMAHAGFDENKPAIVVSTGVSMYLTKEANVTTLRQIAKLKSGSLFAMTYILPMELADPDERPGRQMAEKGARASGTPFISFFSSEEIIGLAREAGFKKAHPMSAKELAQRYFKARADGLHPTKSEEILIATT